MEEPLTMYRRIVGEQPASDEGWFAVTLARFRGGDEGAVREISGRCLRFALEIAEQRAVSFADLPLLDVIQEANAGLVAAIKAFQGSNLAEFRRFAEHKIDECLTVLA